MHNNGLILVVCAPYPEYESAPQDQSHSELFDCPKCKNKMWLSKKKKGVLAFSSLIGKEILLGCYNCIKNEIHKDPSLVIKSTKVGI